MKFQSIAAPAAIVLTFVISASAFASAITWNTPGNISADTDVITAGNLVTAINLNGAATTVNTVPFAAGTTDGLSSAGSLGPAIWGAPGLSSSYTALVSPGIYTYPAMDITLTFNSLTAGDTYKVQVWANDPGASMPIRTENVSDGVGHSATINIYETATELGQYIVGTFVADGSHSQIVVFTGGNVVDQINAYQLRDVTVVPEPASLVLGALGGLALLLVARRRRAAAR